MKVAITGSTGLIGNYLSRGLRSRDWEVFAIGCNDLAGDVQALSRKLSGMDMLINLAGAPIMHRWSKAYKDVMYNSRVEGTRNLVKAMGLSESPPPLLISASAVGIYQDGGPHTETNAVYTNSFLGNLTQQWEKAALQNSADTRVAVLRFGVVLAADGGALAKQLPLFRLGLGGMIGNGLQPFPWIHIEDILQIILFIQSNQVLNGVFNAVAPEQINNKEFTGKLAKILNKPAIFTVPGFALKVLFGEGASALTSGQAVIPERLLKLGFQFRFQDLDVALKDLIK